MDQEQLAQLRATLIKEKELIESELSQIAKKNPLIKDDWIAVGENKTDSSEPMDDRAHDVTTMEERRAVEQNLELRLKEINDTIVRIDAGTYGTCVSCRSPIEPRRLEVMRVATTCISCSKRTTLT